MTFSGGFLRLCDWLFDVVVYPILILLGVFTALTLIMQIHHYLKWM